MGNLNSSRPAAAIAALLRSAQRDEARVLIERYADDPRAQVQKARTAALRRLERESKETERLHNLYATMQELGGPGIVLGVDEVGRGSVAGPLTVCAVQLPSQPYIDGLNDSKQLSAARRELLCEHILEHACAVGICHIPAEEIDRVGMSSALRRAVAGAVQDTGVHPDCVLMDGNPLGAVPCEKNVIHGDARVACIAAASIVAKVTRDALMVELDVEYPGYYLAQSKGYASPQHIQAIRQRGLSAIHRVSFCGNFLENKTLF